MGIFRRDQGIKVQETQVAELIVAFRRASEEWSDVHRSMTKRLDELREDLDALKGQHERLRGRVYGVGMHKNPLTEARQETREELKARLLGSRFTPGRPANHGSE